MADFNTSMELPGFERLTSPAAYHTEAYIIACKKHAEEKSGDWHKGIQRWRALYDFDHYSRKPKQGEVQYNDPSATALVDTAVGVLSARDIEWRAMSFTPDATTEAETGRVEKLLHGAMEKAIEREGYSIPYFIYLHGARDGSFSVCSVWDPILHNRFAHTALTQDPNNLETGVREVVVFDEIPLRTQVIDPLELYVIPGGPRRWRVIIRETEMTVLDAESMYDFKHPTFGSYTYETKARSKCKIIDYWAVDDKSGGVSIINAVLCDNKFIPGYESRVMEGYEDLPYEIGFFKPVSLSDPSGWGHSIIRPIESSLSSLERVVNRRNEQINKFTAMPIVIKAIQGRDVDVDPGVGSKVVIDPSEDVGFPLWPGNAPDVGQHITMMETRIQQAGFSDLSISAASQATGFALSQLSDQNSIKLQEPLRQFEMFWSNWARKILRLVKNFAGNSVLRVYGRMRGKDFADQFVGDSVADFLVRARITPTWPGGAVRDYALAAQAKGVLSDTTLMERHYHIEQPDDERGRRLQQEAENHPIMRLFGVLGVLQEKANGLDKQEAKAAAMALQFLEKALGTGASMGGGGSAPGSESPGSMGGLQSVSGKPTNQAMGGNPQGEDFDSWLGQLVGASTSPSGMVV